LVPYAAGLLHTIDAFVQLHHPILSSGGFKSRWSFKEHSLVFREDAVKESGLDVELVDFSIERHHNMENEMEGFEASSWCSGFVIVNAIFLCKAFRDVANLVATYISVVVLLPLAY
jgi:hypothetical protein